MDCSLHKNSMRMLGGRAFCPTCLGEASRVNLGSLEATAAQMHADRLSAARSRCALPPVYVNASFANYDEIDPRVARIKRAMMGFCRHFEQQRTVRRGFLFSGNSGAGKTLLAAAMANSIIDQGYTALYRSLPALTMAIRASYRNSQLPSSADMASEMMEADFLIIDEVDLHGASDSDYQFLFHVVDGRYASGMRPTVLLSNKSELELQVDLHERIVTRVLNGTKAICFDWQNQRSHPQP